jgi:hypothetical protein
MPRDIATLDNFSQPDKSGSFTESQADPNIEIAETAPKTADPTSTKPPAEIFNFESLFCAASAF